MRGPRLAFTTLVVMVLLLATHSASVGQSAGPTTKVLLQGAGATFPALLYKKWIHEFSSQNPDVVIDYKDVGSGEGVKRFILAYNLPGLGGDLKLSREVYTDILLRKIEKWNDPRIQAINPTLRLPNRSIAVAARQDGSGTTFALANHLSAISPAWRDGPGVGYMVDWGGRAMRARGNEGVAALVKIGEGTIGYVEYGFAKKLGLSMATL
jgi:phosphate transport system substrate-binding protein